MLVNNESVTKISKKLAQEFTEAKNILDRVQNGQPETIENINRALESTGDLPDGSSSLPELGKDQGLESSCLDEDSGTGRRRIGHMVGYCL